MQLPGFWKEILRNWVTRIFLALFTGVALPASYKRALAQLGFTSSQLARVLPRVRSLDDWTALWRSLGDTLMAEATPFLNAQQHAESLALLDQAASAYFIAQIPLSTQPPERLELLELVRNLYRQCTPIAGIVVEEVEIAYNGGIATSYFQHPHNTGRRGQKKEGPPVPAILILTSLGSSKEEMAIFSDPFVEAGLATLRLELPGIGSSKGALSLEDHFICQEALNYLAARPDVNANALLIAGVSLVTYWVLKTAAVDRRLKGVIAISPAMLLRQQWESLPSYYWHALQQAFDTPDLDSTWEVASRMVLFRIIEEIRCPILLFHGGLDQVSHPQVLEWFHQHANAPTDARFYRWQGHFLWGVLQSDVLPISVGWALHQVRQTHPGQRHIAPPVSLSDPSKPASSPLPSFTPAQPIAPLSNPYTHEGGS